jgi:predicted nucleic acid-binding protein
MRTVLDTNIFVSSYLGPLGAPARIVAAIPLARFVWIYSEGLLAEYRRP